MKNGLVILFVCLTMACQRNDSTVDALQTDAITRTVLDIFGGTDEVNWNRVSQSFAPQVLLDYSSFSQLPASTLTPNQITTGWQALLPGFERTQHQVGNFDLQQTNQEATVFCYGTATHYLPQPDGRNTWTVVGTYDFHLIRQADRWLVDRMRFNFRYQDGNTNLPNLARQRVSHGQGR